MDKKALQSPIARLLRNLFFEIAEFFPEFSHFSIFPVSHGRGV